MNMGYNRSRWQISDLRQSCPLFKVNTNQGFWQVMRRLKVHYKASRSYIHSPDLNYEEKFSRIITHLAQMNSDSLVLFIDELTYYNHPSTADAYELSGNFQAKATRAYGSEKTFRIVGALNPVTGMLTFVQKSKISVAQFIAFLHLLSQTYPDKTLFLVMDNWPIHYHPDVLAVLNPQLYQQDFNIPGSWKNLKPKQKYLKMNKLNIQFLPLPTYASWLNPIEKVWKWLKKDIIHNHSLANEWILLKELVYEFLQNFSEESPILLAFTGLNNPKSIYGKALHFNSG